MTVRSASVIHTGIACALLCGAASAAFAQQGVVPTWTLQPDLQIGGGSDGPTLFSEIRGIALTRSGNIFVLEFKDQELRVFDPKGSFLRRAGRRGAGPGELGNANGIAIGADDVVWMNDEQNSRFSLYRADGNFLKQIVTPIDGYGWVWRGSVVAPDRVLDDLGVQIPTSKIDPTTHRPIFESRLRFVTASGKSDTVDYPRCPGRPLSAPANLVYGRPGDRSRAYMSLPFRPFTLQAYTRQNTVWCTPSDDYRLLVGTIGGTLREVVRRQFPDVPVTAAERQREIIRLDSAQVKYGPLISGDPSAIPKVKPAIAAIFADDLGRVWVRRNGVPENAPVFEVYDATGRQVATVTSKGAIGDQVAIAGDAMITVNLDEDDVPSVVRYRIIKRSH
ncbi:MAG TPA: 6-bladed beta-propeller [Gemmatimonadales bacterium]|jgi:hypothetical protein